MLSPFAQIFLLFLKQTDPKSFTRFYNEFREEDHPRDKDGQFASKEEDADKENSDTEGYFQRINKALGEEFTGYTGKSAINKLLKERKGHIKDAFNREDIGGISLVWGNSKFGLQHIIERRLKTEQDLKSLLDAIPSIIEKGEISQSYKGRFEINYNKKRIIVEPIFKDKGLQFIFTAYEVID